MSKPFVCSEFKKLKENTKSQRMFLDSRHVSLDFCFSVNTVLTHTHTYMYLQVVASDVQVLPWEISTSSTHTVMLCGAPINQTPSRHIQRQKVIY